MALFSRRPRPPAGLRALFGEHERVLAIAEDGPTAVVATQFGLWLPVAEQAGPAAELRIGSAAELGIGSAAVTGKAPGWRRIGWDQVVKATWAEDGLQVIEGVLDDAGVVTDLPVVRCGWPSRATCRRW